MIVDACVLFASVFRRKTDNGPQHTWLNATTTSSSGKKNMYKNLKKNKPTHDVPIVVIIIVHIGTYT